MDLKLTYFNRASNLSNENGGNSITLPDSDQVCGWSPEVDCAAAAEKDDDESAERFGRKTSSQT